MDRPGLYGRRSSGKLGNDEVGRASQETDPANRIVKRLGRRHGYTDVVIRVTGPTTVLGLLEENG